MQSRFQGKPFNITVIQVYAPTSNAEEAEVEWFYEDLQDRLELYFSLCTGAPVQWRGSFNLYVSETLSSMDLQS